MKTITKTETDEKIECLADAIRDAIHDLGSPHSVAEIVARLRAALEKIES